ncbi:hypothetical protein ACFWJ4_29530 [Kitasatospora sp. NPDC127067]|uniref:hypothetical protein n=1 Tax=Kitasatospora sp. NPDC127067 TaxID=3347126 RepID=UPI0036590746
MASPTSGPVPVDHGEAVFYGTNGRILVEVVRVGGNHARTDTSDVSAAEEAYPAAQRALTECSPASRGCRADPVPHGRPVRGPVSAPGPVAEAPEEEPEEAATTERSTDGTPHRAPNERASGGGGHADRLRRAREGSGG